MKRDDISSALRRPDSVIRGACHGMLTTGERQTTYVRGA